MLNIEDEQSRCFAWSIDLIKAIEERPRWAKLLLRLAMGKYAFNEYMGLRKTLAENNYINNGYDLENQDYHNESIPIFWWGKAIEN